MYAAVLFTIAKTWRIPSICQHTTGLRCDIHIYIIYIYIMKILLSHKKQWNSVICSNVDGTTEYCDRWNKSEKDKYCKISFICRLQKIIQMKWNEVKGAHSCLTLCNPMDHIVHGILQARIWSGYPFPSPGDLPNPGIKPRSPSLQVDSLPAESQGKCKYKWTNMQNLNRLTNSLI